MDITPLLILKVIISLIFIMAIMPKIAGKQMAKDMFAKLGAEPHGRYLTAVLEILAVFLLWVPGYLGRGALLAVLLMIGAIGSHLTKLGINQMFYMGIVILLSSGYILMQTGLPF